jgi:hypothetical protein
MTQLLDSAVCLNSHICTHQHQVAAEYRLIAMRLHRNARQELYILQLPNPHNLLGQRNPFIDIESESLRIIRHGHTPPFISYVIPSV